jgi:2-polyprenyl-6-methoxyphenol hydroxylase-like FAD-dependent oxidoreductase
MAFATLLLQKLEQSPNFKLFINSEVSELYHDSNSGLVNAARVLGKRGEALDCDAVVICTGA